MFMKLAILMKSVLFIIFINSVLSDKVFSFNNIEDIKTNDKAGKLCPNNHTRCNYNQTCCETLHKSYHCCRYSNAVCCPDKFHCCPQGSTCDSERKRCTRNIIDPMEWPLVEVEEKVEKKMMESKTSDTLYGYEMDSKLSKMNKEVTCPNNKTKCKDTKTCCITKHGNYYCCPHQNAVCCPDKYHCCPEKTTCDTETNKCVNSSVSVEKLHRFIVNKEPFSLIPAEMKNFNWILYTNKLEKQCSNSPYKCPGHKKCCSMENGKFGCCDLDKGVCCPDMKTCCPHGTECDVKNKQCVSKSKDLIPAVMHSKSDVCPDKKTECQSFETCCSVGYDSYGCCPYKNATCCSDLASCCPHNTVCDLKKQMCVPKPKTMSLISIKKTLIHFNKQVQLESTCPNDFCDNKQTCCLMEQNQYGCCPLNNGVCCSDKKSCCPNGYECTSDGCIKH